MKRVSASKKSQNQNESQHKPDFDELLLEAVDEALSFLGKPAKTKIRSYLEKTAGIQKKDIPHELEKFVLAIQEIFGTGAYLLEVHIMKRLYERIGKDFEYCPKGNELIFTEYVDAARSSNLIKEHQGSSSDVTVASHCLPVVEST